METINRFLNQVFNEDAIVGMKRIPENSIDLVIADPPYCLGKDYGNHSDKLCPDEYLKWTRLWIDTVIPKMKKTASLYIFVTWRFAPEIFSYVKTKLTMINEIIWDRKVPSMGGSTRRFSSVHDNIGLFVKSGKYYFDIDSVRIPYDEETKKARTRSIFVGKKWLEVGYNPKDLWSCTRLHAEDPERQEHPTQKPLEIIERMIKASCPVQGIVLDPFMGSGTTAMAAYRTNRQFIGFELNSDYCKSIKKRLEDAKVFSLRPAAQDSKVSRNAHTTDHFSLFSFATNKGV